MWLQTIVYPFNLVHNLYAPYVPQMLRLNTYNLNFTIYILYLETKIWFMT